MFSFIIAQNDEIKETFSYEIPFNETTRQSIIEYAYAHYGSDAIVTSTTEEGQVNLESQSHDSPKIKW